MMIIDEVVDFLSSIPPFQLLDEETVLALSKSVSLEFHPKGTMILSQDGPPSDSLQIVVSGGAKVFMKSGDEEELIIDYRSRGDAIGFLSLFSADRSRTNVLAVEDTTCYLIPREPFVALLDRNPQIREYFLRTFLTKYMDKAFADMRNRSLLFGGGEKLLFTTTIGQLVTQAAVTAPADISIQAAAELMSCHRISSLVLLDEDGAPAGMVTDRDLRDKVAAKARDLGEPVSNVMSSTLFRIEARDYCFEALLKMIRHNIHHLLVVDEGKLRAVITNHDLMMLQGTSPISVARDIENAQGIEELAPSAGKIDHLIGLLLKDGAKASNITRIITEINDRLVRKVLELTERRLGPPPLPWCWVVFGSEGRKEQTFKTDQDNAIIFADPITDTQEREAREYFARLAAETRDALTRCGFPVCPANYMASNPQWCQPLRTWKRYFSDWITNPTAEAVLRSLIFFDFRALHGATGLAEQLREHLTTTLEREKAFLGFVANILVQNRPPLGFFQQFVVEKSGEHKDLLNLKFKGISFFVDLARFFSFERGVRETATLDRFHALAERHTIVREYADDLEHAFEFIMLLRIHHQFEQISRGAEPDNFIDPNRLTYLEKRTIKEAFALVSRIQDLLIERYRASIW
jgi:CBS domain-containing protein